MSTTHPFERQLIASWPPGKWRDVTTILAVSGGPDSVSLLRAMAIIGRDTGAELLVAHFNHHLRGAESDGDEAFVRQLSDDMHLKCEVGHAETVVSSGGDGLEAKARQQRYAFLRCLADQVGARYVATAHSADDQAETILHRIIRGTGLAGLAGIPAARRLSHLTTIIRPLLSFDRQSIQQYLIDVDQSYRDDSSNRCLTFTRNRIRHELMPELANHYNSHVAHALNRLAKIASDAQAIIDDLVDGLLDQSVVFRSESRIEVNRAILRTKPPYLIRELMIGIWKQQKWALRDMSGDKWHKLSAMARGETRLEQSTTLPGRVQARACGDRLELERQID